MLYGYDETLSRGPLRPSLGRARSTLMIRPCTPSHTVAQILPGSAKRRAPPFQAVLYRSPGAYYVYVVHLFGPSRTHCSQIRKSGREPSQPHH